MMQKVSLFKSMALTVIILSSTLLNAITAPAQDQSAQLLGNKATNEQMAKMSNPQQSQNTALPTMSQNLPQTADQERDRDDRKFNASSMTRSIQGQPVQSSRAIIKLTTLAELRNALMSYRGNQEMIMRILFEYTKTGKEVPQTLDLSNLDLTSIPRILAHPYYFENVLNLNLTKNRLRNLSGIQVLKNLRGLMVGYNPITDIRHLQGLSSLAFFSAVGNRLNSSSSAFFPRSLETMILDGNNISDLPGLKTFKVRSISLKGNPISSLCWAQNLFDNQTAIMSRQSASSTKYYLEKIALNSSIAMPMDQIPCGKNLAGMRGQGLVVFG